MAATQQLCSGSQSQEENYLNHNLLNLCSGGENLVLLQGSVSAWHSRTAYLALED